MKKCILLKSPRVFLDTVLNVQTTYQNQHNLLHWKHNYRFFFLLCFPRRNIFAWNKLHCLIRSLTFLKTKYDLQNVHRQKSTSTLLFICYKVDICLSIMAHIIEVWRSVDTEAYSVAHSTLHHKTVGLMTPWDGHTVRNWVSPRPLSFPRHYKFIDGICAALFSFIYMLKMKTVLVQLRSTVHYTQIVFLHYIAHTTKTAHRIFWTT